MKIILTALILFINVTVFSQTSDKDEALKFGKVGIKLVDEGKYDDGIKLFKKAQKLDPDNIIYPYEIAYAYVLQKKYKEAIEICEPLKNDKNVIDEVYRLLGNCYDFLDQPQKALDVYNEGLKKFPNSGKLYHEIGICYEGLKKYNDAIKSFEIGIMVNPNFSSNYYNASKIYAQTEDEIWALIYAETFISLEPGTNRTKEIGKLLYDTYQKGINVHDDKNATISFCQHPDLDSKELKLFETNFEIAFTLVLAVSDDKSKSISSLSKMRQSFIKLWYDKGFNEKYKIGIFDYMKKVYDSGNGNAYDYFYLGYGDRESTLKWVKEHEEEYRSFEKFVNKNRLELTVENSVYRGK